MSFFKKVVEESRLITVMYDNLSEDIKQTELYKNVTAYLEKYVEYNNISVDEAIDHYTQYIIEFNKDSKQFLKTNKYPYELKGQMKDISREAYDIVLLFSVLLTPHRFRIMDLLKKHSNKEQNALYIGLGTGLEMDLTKEMYQSLTAYDLSINAFLSKEFKDVEIHTELYVGQKTSHYNAVYLIELLEHLEAPYDLLQITLDSLSPGGKCFLTTATNIPQFDHLYNFPEEHSDFEKQVENMGFKVVLKEFIPHNFMTLNIASSNHFYILEKK